MFNKNALLKTINEKLNKWDERSSFSIRGVNNLSRSDLGTLELYATYNGPLMRPVGGVRQVLEKFGYEC